MSLQESADSLAEAIRYFPSPIDPSITLFRCDRYRCSMTRAACARSWDRAQRCRFKNDDRFGPCKACPIGAANSGKSAAVYSRMANLPTLCCRCLFGSTKLVANRICVSCSNRASEYIKNRNGKGTVPRFALAVSALSVRWFSSENPVPQVWSVNHASGPEELWLDLLRRHRGNLVFLPAEGEALPEVLEQRGPVIFKRVPLVPPIAGEHWGIVGEDNPEWRAPTDSKPPRSRPRGAPATAPKAADWDAAWENAKAAIGKIDGAGGMTMSQLARTLEDRGIPTARGGPWSPGKVERALKGTVLGRPKKVKPVELSSLSRPVVKLLPPLVISARAEASMVAALVEGLRAA